MRWEETCSLRTNTVRTPENGLPRLYDHRSKVDWVVANRLPRYNPRSACRDRSRVAYSRGSPSDGGPAVPFRGQVMAQTFCRIAVCLALLVAGVWPATTFSQTAAQQPDASSDPNRRAAI